MKLKIIIEKSSDSYSAYAENVEGIYGHADTVQEAKASALEGLEMLVEDAPKQLPNWILEGKYEIEYKFDIESFLSYYKGIFTLSALEKLTGINQKQIQHYSSGLKKPRTEQRKKIENSLHRLGNELLAIEF